MNAISVVWRAALLICALATSVVSAAADDKASPGTLAAAVKPFVDKHTLAGAVMLVADKDKVLAVEYVGYADIADNTLMGPTTLFWIASQSKPITAAALMMLLDEGKVKLDDPVEKYLPEMKDLVVKGTGQKPSHPITLREILNHTSGMAFQSKREQPTLDGLSLRDAVASYAKTPLQSEPGTKYSYSNMGINTAGRIIEVVSGMPYEEFLQKRLLDPLGMKDTTFWPNDEQIKRLARSYRPTKDKKDLEATNIGQLKYPLSDRQRQPMPAGGLFATAADVAHFCQMVLAGGVYKGKRLLSEDAVKQMTSKQTGNLPTSYGLGWSVGGDSFGHGGAHATNMAIDSKRGLIFVWMVQQTGGFPGDGGQSQGAFRKAAAALLKN